MARYSLGENLAFWIINIINFMIIYIVGYHQTSSVRPSVQITSGRSVPSMDKFWYAKSVFQSVDSRSLGIDTIP